MILLSHPRVNLLFGECLVLVGIISQIHSVIVYTLRAITDGAIYETGKHSTVTDLTVQFTVNYVGMKINGGVTDTSDDVWLQAVPMSNSGITKLLFQQERSRNRMGCSCC